MKTVLKVVVMLVAVLCIFALFKREEIGGWIDPPLLVSGEGQTYMLQPGSGISTLAYDLAREGKLTRPRLASVLGRVLGGGGAVRAGEYRLTPGMSFMELLARMRAGQVVQYSLTFPEGWAFRQIRAALATAAHLEQASAGLDDAQLMSVLGHANEHPEGRFFPDTYLYARGMRDLDVLVRAYEKMESVLAEEWAQREEGLPYETAYEALIMASIIEKETGLASERGQIAGVFVRRLRKGMRLQTDPTVIYGLGPAWTGNLKRIHLSQRTPYNTYVISGLPPTPIAMPGREAIHAALHPVPGTALYFVARGDGGHQFSASLAEHNAAVRKYQIRHRAKNYRSQPKEPSP